MIFRPRSVCLGLLGCLALFLAFGCAGNENAQQESTQEEGTAAHTNSSSTQPNIVFILTDDLDYESASLFPSLRSQLIDKGTTFDNDFVSNSLCCPSRTTILTGLYAHNHDIETNNPPRGGFEKFVSGGLEKETIAYRLQQSGYTTGLYGKYLNHYPGNDLPTRIPSGWDEWHAWGDTLGHGGDENSANTEDTESNAAYYDYKLNENGRIVSYGDSSDDYMTDVLSAKAQDFIRNASSGSKPFFLYLATSAPHGPPVPAERHQDTLLPAQAPRPPSFDQEDVSSMPPWIRNMSRFSAQDINSIDALYLLRMSSMLAVDEMVNSVVKELDADEQLDNTFIFFTSDNGLLLGQHRIRNDKRYPYEEAVHTPLFIRGPGVPAGSKVKNLVDNADFAPTFAELAGIPFPSDGRSFASLLRGENPPWRSGILLEGFGQTNQKRALPAYEGIRTETSKYVEYATGDKELFDLKADPYELNNVYDRVDPSLLANLKTRLEALRSCAGEGCQKAEDAS